MPIQKSFDEKVLQDFCQRADLELHNQNIFNTESNTISTVTVPVLDEVANITETCELQPKKTSFEKNQSVEKFVLLHLMSIYKN